MIAAAIPSLTLALGLWVFLGTLIALIAAIFASFLIHDARVSRRTTTIAAVAIFVLVMALSGLAAAAIHAAAWEDYRRSLGK